MLSTILTGLLSNVDGAGGLRDYGHKGDALGARGRYVAPAQAPRGAPAGLQALQVHGVCGCALSARHANLSCSCCWFYEKDTEVSKVSKVALAGAVADMWLQQKYL